MTRIINLKIFLMIFFVIIMSQQATFANSDYQDFIKFENLITTDEMMPYFIDSLSNNAYLLENEYQIIPESEQFTYPDSTVVITSLFIAAGGAVGLAYGNASVAVAEGAVGLAYGNASVDFAGVIAFAYNAAIYGMSIGSIILMNDDSSTSFKVLAFTALAAIAGYSTGTARIVRLTLGASGAIAGAIGVDDLYNFYHNRLEFHFRLIDKDEQPVNVSCLAFFAYNPVQHALAAEYDACYLTVITGQENTTLIKMPQTVDGLVRLNETIPIIGKWDDWAQGQTKVVDAFTIPLAPPGLFGE